MAIVKLPAVRLFFPALVEATEYQGRWSYSTKCGIPRNGDLDKAINAAILQEASIKWPKNPAAKIAQFAPIPQQFPYRSGDTVGWEGAEGLNVLTAVKGKDAGKPLLLSNVRYSGDEYPQSRGKFLRILDQSGKVGVEVTDEAGVTRVEPVEVEEEITVPYSGCYANVSVEFWAQQADKASGIRCSLRGVQFARDGDSFAGGSKAKSDEFDSMDGADADDLV